MRYGLPNEGYLSTPLLSPLDSAILPPNVGAAIPTLLSLIMRSTFLTMWVLQAETVSRIVGRAAMVCMGLLARSMNLHFVTVLVPSDSLVTANADCAQSFAAQLHQAAADLGPKGGAASESQSDAQQAAQAQPDRGGEPSGRQQKSSKTMAVDACLRSF